MAESQYKPHPITQPLVAEDIDYNFDLAFRLLRELVTDFGGILPVSKGGTGLSNYLEGDMLYADTPSSLAQLNAVATGSAIISQGPQTAPVWGKINVVDPQSHLTGLTTKGDLLVYNGSAYVRLGAGSDGQVLQSSASASAGLEWTTASGGSGSIDTILTDGDLVMLDDDGNVLYSG